MEKKYKLTEETLEIYGHVLHRIMALRDFGNARKGDIGGWIENENNLSHNDNCWIYDDANVYGSAKISENARVFSDARVFGDALVFGNA